MSERILVELRDDFSGEVDVFAGLREASLDLGEEVLTTPDPLVEGDEVLTTPDTPVGDGVQTISDPSVGDGVLDPLVEGGGEVLTISDPLA